MEPPVPLASYDGPKSRLKALIDASVALNSAREPDALLRTILDLATQNVGADRGALFLRDPRSGDLVTRIFHGDEVRQIAVKAGHGLVGIVAESGKPVHIADAYADPRFDRTVDAATGYRTDSLLAVPLTLRTGEIVGVLEVLNKREGAFTKGDEGFLQAFGAQVAVALENERLVAERIRAERLAGVGQLAAALVHDLSNPLSGIRGYVDVIQQSPPPEVLARCLAGIRRQTARMQDMVRAILAFVRGERPYLFSKSDLDTLLEEVAEDLRAAHGPDGVRVEREGSRVGHARVDPAAIRRLVDNLARNAAGAMPQGGRLAIASERAGDRWRLAVRDEGVGMTEGVRSRLFEPFFTQGKKGGTGLGLAIVKQIVDAHGGTIDVESAPGKGTTVRMEFPVEAAEPRAGT